MAKPKPAIQVAKLRKMFDHLREMIAEGERTHVNQAGAMAAYLEQQGVPTLVRCTGEAHSNPHIDNCSVCAPRWGWVEKTEEAAEEVD